MHVAEFWQGLDEHGSIFVDTVGVGEGWVEV
jgi:hypothetical protein